MKAIEVLSCAMMLLIAVVLESTCGEEQLIVASEEGIGPSNRLTSVRAVEETYNTARNRNYALASRIRAVNLLVTTGHQYFRSSLEVLDGLLLDPSFADRNCLTNVIAQIMTLMAETYVVPNRDDVRRGQHEYKQTETIVEIAKEINNKELSKEEQEEFKGILQIKSLVDSMNGVAKEELIRLETWIQQCETNNVLNDVEQRALELARTRVRYLTVVLHGVEGQEE